MTAPYLIDYSKTEQNAKTAAPLFDRDTASRYAPEQAELIVRSFNAPVMLKTMKVYGANDYSASVDYYVNGVWERCEGWENLNLSSVHAWQTFTLKHPVETSKVRIAIVPTQKRPKGIAEIAFGAEEEIHVVSTRVIADGSSGSTSSHLYALEKQSQAKESPLTTFSFTTAYHSEQVSSARLSYDVEGVSGGASVIRAINDELAQGGLLLQAVGGINAGKRVHVTEEINPQWLKAGLNKIKFISHGGEIPQPYRISNVELSISTTTTDARQRKSRLVAFAPQGGVSYKEYAYLRGFVETHGSSVAKVTVDGKAIAPHNGAFEALVKVKGAKAVNVTAKLEDGSVLMKEVPLDTTLSLFQAKSVQLSESGAAYLSGKQRPIYTKKVLAVAGDETVVTLGDAKLDIEKTALKADREIRVATLGERDLPPLDPGMVNVTKGDTGYRFLPHGTKFDTENRLDLAYDEKKLPEGMSGKDVKTYFFDEETGRWLPLPKVAAASGVVTSKTTHFTDMINAVIKTPDAPQAKAYSATQIKDLKVANPGAKVNLIEAPKASSQGDAQLSYPLEIPAGRHGMAPRLSVNYSSGASNSWMGLGWNLSTPSIGIDTRWGVPHYYGDVESETYTLAGQQLTPMAHRGAPVPRTAEKRFYPRVEGAFSKIVRHGASPKTYWWEVTSKDGTKSYYGGMPSSGVSQNAVLTDAKGNIAHWALKQTIDVYGNTVTYTYVKVEDAGVGNGHETDSVAGYQLYVEKINYTGFNGDDGAYDVLFLRDRNLQEDRRKDVAIDARLGFKRVTADLLRKVKVQFQGVTFRSYAFEYTKGAFEKTLLAAIKQYDADGELFNTHSFSYFDEVRKDGKYDPFKKQSWIVDPIAYQHDDGETITVPTAPGIPDPGTGTETPVITPPTGDGSTVTQSVQANTDALMSALGSIGNLSGTTLDLNGIFSNGNSGSSGQAGSGFVNVQASVNGASGSGVDDTARDGVVDLIYATGNETPLDYIRAWEAPFDGAVSVDAPVALVSVGENADADGVRVSIQHQNAVLWNAVIAPDDFSARWPYGTEYIDVKKGDLVLFRVQGRSNGINDVVSWSPVIAYADQPQDTLDANELPLYNYCFTKEFIPQANAADMPYSGVINISGDIVKPIVSDDVNFTLVKYSGKTFEQTLLWSHGYKASERVEATPDFGDIKVEAGDSIYAVVSAQSNVDFKAISWKPTVRYKDLKKRFIDRVILGDVDISTFSKKIQPQLTVHQVLKNCTGWTATDDAELVVNAAIPQTWNGTETINFTLKSDGLLLAKQNITAKELLDATYEPLTADVAKGQNVYIEYHGLGDLIGVDPTFWSPEVTANSEPVSVETSGLSELPSDGPVFYRGWGEYVYAASEGDENASVDIADLKNDSEGTSSQSGDKSGSDADGTTKSSALSSSSAALSTRLAAVTGKRIYFEAASSPTLKSSGIPTSSGFISALSGSESTSKTLSMSATVGYVGPTTYKTGTVGGKAGSSWTENKGVLALVDIDGDSLPDQVFVDGDDIKYKKNLSHNGLPRFAKAEVIAGPSKFHHSKTVSSNRGVEAHYYAFAGLNKSKTTSTTDTYFSDVNGDGLIDIVRKGVVHYNRLNSEGVPTFDTNSEQTPNPVVQSTSVERDGWIEEQTPEELEQLAKENPLHDTVKVWEAPENGTVSIYAPVSLVQDTSSERDDYEKADGVLVSIEHKEYVLWSQRIEQDDNDTYMPSTLGGVEVTAGDRIYFRVDSVYDGAYDKVNWAPIIAYTDKADRLDANNLPVYRFNAGEDFLLSGSYVTTPIEGTVAIRSTFDKNETSDDLVLRFVQLNTPDGERVLWEQEIGQGAEHNATMDPPYYYDVKKGDDFRFEIVSDTNVDWANIHWKPKLVYIATPDEDIPLFDEDEKALLFFHAVPTLYPYKARYQHSIPWVPDENMTTAVIRPLLVSQNYDIDDAKAVFSIKRDATLLGKQTVEYQNGQLVTSLQSFPVDLTNKDGIYVEYHTSDTEFASYLADHNASAVITVDGNTTLTHIAGVHTKKADQIFGPMYRNWGQFVYNANEHRNESPIFEYLLEIDPSVTNVGNGSAIDSADDKESLEAGFEQEGYNPAKSVFIMMVPIGATGMWHGADAATQVGKTTIGSSRMGLKSIEEDDVLKTDGDNSVAIRGINKVTKSEAEGFAISSSVGYSESDQTNDTLTDFIDMNGDRYPDIVGKDRVQFTTMSGALEANATSGVINGFFGNGTAHSGTWSTGTFALAKLLTSGDSDAYTTSSNDPSAGLTVQSGETEDETHYAYRDINGDGLPDRVSKNGYVALNLGYEFAPAENWGFGSIQSGESKSFGAGASINLANYSISAGLSINTADNKHNHTLTDLNGDGLIDETFIADGFVKTKLNTGNGFTDTIEWSDKVKLYKSETRSGDVNAYYTACVNIPVPPIRFCVNPGGSAGISGSRDKATLTDIDGDGYIDYLTSSDADDLDVKISTIGKTNLLKTVQRPLGATITLDYERKGNTYKNPHSKWVLSTVETHDGHKGDGADTMKQLITYKDGYYDRHEREFYGFAQVTTADVDTANGDAVYRKNIMHYINGNYYEKGLNDYTKVTDDANRTYVEKFNTYKTVDIFTQQPLTDEQKAEDDRNAFSQLARAQTLYYEGAAEAGQQTAQDYTYDRYGNVLMMHDYGETSDPNDDYKAYVTYYQNTDAYILSVPQTIHIYDNAGKLLRHREATVDDHGAVTQVRVNAGSAPINTDMTYDVYGNLASITYPPNHKGQRYALHYAVDDVVHTYTTAMRDSFGYTATAEYDYRFGAQTRQTDINEQPILTTLDAKGRIETITGPLEADTGETTIKHRYYPDAEVPYALTQHYDESRPDTIDTVTFIDGLMRVIQTKKDAAIDEDKDGVAFDGMIVSGHVDFDSFGRTVATYYPVAETPADADTFSPEIDTIAPTRTAYDVMDRKVVTTLPDGATLANAYGFGEDREGIKRFHTLSTDANSNTAENFKDVRGRITSVLQHNPAANQDDIWTSYSYDAVNQLIQVKDDKENLTQAVYDLAGRRTHLYNPDTGWVESVYDPASNVVKKITPNLRAEGKSIGYVYDYNRLSRIDYPDNPQNNVTYTYGDDASAYNAGRIVKVSDGSGIRKFEYGKLGETTKETRTLFTYTGAEPKTYVTNYRYDTWNRLREIVYPDGEVLTHEYDGGGKLEALEGRKGSHKYRYLKALTYDRFGQRVFVRYANDTTMTYAYEDERRRLANVVAANDKRTFMDNAYAYDNMQNILSVGNRAAVAVDSPDFGGETSQSFSYDNLYQLTSANGTWTTRQGHEHRYDLKMAYDTIGNIEAKDQRHERLPYEGNNWIKQKGTTYDWMYRYNGEHPHAATRIGNRMFTYDENGNQTGWTNVKNHTNRVIKWDEENRIASVSDNGQTSYYVYDADGERTLKRTSQGETFYVNPYYVIREGEVASKHVFVGSQRIATKLVKQEPHNNDNQGQKAILEKEQYYYHPDHLGSSSFITDRNGKVYEHLEYFPSGEEFGHEHSNTQVTPYRFTGKEYDEMTGLYYYGARYYDPRTSVWQSPDPILDQYMDGQTNGGVFNPMNLGLFSQTYNNPVNLTDSTGLCSDSDTCQGSWSTPTKEPSADQSALGVQRQFSFGSGDYIPDPKKLEMSDFMDEDKQINDSINNGNMMRPYYDQAKQSGKPVDFTWENKRFNGDPIGATLAGNKSALLGRIAGTISGTLSVNKDGTYNVTGKVTLADKQYNWNPDYTKKDSNSGLKNFAISVYSSLRGIRNPEALGTPGYKPVPFNTMSPAYKNAGGMKIDFVSDYYFQISGANVK